MKRFFAADFEPPTEIGSGAYGRVFKARHKELGNVAYKTMNKPSDIGEIVHAEKMFAHENIIKIHGLFFSNSGDNKPKGYVMELLDYTLHEVIHNESNDPSIPFYSRYKALLIFIQICEGLEALHSENILHRDVKPSNVLVSKNLEKVKLCDFGTCSASLTANTTGVGTYFYMAPEVANMAMEKGSVYTEKCDVYSAAILLWELIYQSIPYKTKGLILLKEVSDGLRPSFESHRMNPALEALVNRAWHSNPDERPTIASFREALEDILTRLQTDYYKKSKYLSHLSDEIMESFMHVNLMLNCYPDQQRLYDNLREAQAQYGISLPFHESEFADSCSKRKIMMKRPVRKDRGYLLIELNQLSRVQSHPNIISMYGLVFDDSLKCIGFVTERMDTLFLKVISPPRLSLTNGMAVIHGICDGLEYIHEQGIVLGVLELSGIYILNDFQRVILGSFECSSSRAIVYNNRSVMTTLKPLCRYKSVEEKKKDWIRMMLADINNACDIFLEILKRWSKSDDVASEGRVLQYDTLLEERNKRIHYRSYDAANPPLSIREVNNIIDATLEQFGRDGVVCILENYYIAFPRFKRWRRGHRKL